MSYQEQLRNATKRRELLLKIREADDKTAFFKEVNENQDFYLSLLQDEDAKVRRLVAQLLAQTKNQAFLAPLFELYCNEKQQMICAGLLKALSQYDLSSYLDILNDREQVLMIKGDKHSLEELKVMRQVLKPYRTLPMHTFVGLKKEVPMVLAIPNGHQEALADELAWLDTKITTLGVMVKTKDIASLMENHLFTAIYFSFCKLSDMSIETLTAPSFATKLVKFLDSCHQENFAYRIRLNLEDEMMAKKVADGLEKASQNRMQNYPHDYEVEIRIRENKKGEGIVYLRLMTIKDERFSYRKSVSSSSIAGHTAALIAHYLQDYVQADGQVLDPLCNDGTLLIERCYAAHPHFVMGLDMQASLMNMAKANAKEAGADIRFVQRDIKTFTHQRRFDEMLTVLPTIVKQEDQDSIEKLYGRILDQVPKLVLDGGILALYTSETKLLTDLANRRRKSLVKKAMIPMIGKKYLYIFEVHEI